MRGGGLWHIITSRVVAGRGQKGFVGAGSVGDKQMIYISGLNGASRRHGEEHERWDGWEITDKRPRVGGTPGTDSPARPPDYDRRPTLNRNIAHDEPDDTDNLFQ